MNKDEFEKLVFDMYTENTKVELKKGITFDISEFINKLWELFQRR